MVWPVTVIYDLASWQLGLECHVIYLLISDGNSFDDSMTWGVWRDISMSCNVAHGQAFVSPGFIYKFNFDRI